MLTWGLRYFYDGCVHLIADVDGVRIVTNDVCEFLQKVPGELSRTVSAKLLYA